MFVSLSLSLSLSVDDPKALIAQGIANARLAITQDNAGNIAEALTFYDKTITLLQQAIAIDTDAESRAVTEKKLSQYVDRKVALKREILKAGGTQANRALPAVQQQQAAPSPQLARNGMLVRMCDANRSIVCLFVCVCALLVCARRDVRREAAGRRGCRFVFPCASLGLQRARSVAPRPNAAHGNADRRLRGEACWARRVVVSCRSSAAIVRRRTRVAILCACFARVFTTRQTFAQISSSLVTLSNEKCRKTAV